MQGTSSSRTGEFIRPSDTSGGRDGFHGARAAAPLNLAWKWQEPMDKYRDLRLLLGGRSPLIVIESQDEKRVLQLLKNLVVGSAAATYRPLFRWTITDGLQRVDIDLAPQSHNADPAEVLGHIRATRQDGFYVLLDFHPYLEDPVNVRRLKDVCLDFEQCHRYVILLGHAVKIPPELESFAATFELELPDEGERARIVNDVAEEWSARNAGQKVRSDKQALSMLIRNLAGMPAEDTRRLARNAIYDDGAIRDDDLPKVMQAKYELLNQNGALSFEYETATFGKVGGMRRLKQWLAQRASVFRGDKDAPPLDPPRGILLTGVQGCGKSLAAKATAAAFGVPLLRLDIATIYNKYHGETERNLRESLTTADAMAPCVLWIDELEKGIASGRDETGTSKRVLGSFLTWMAERASRVFIVATANDISALPPELVRKGRFDEIFFVDLPNDDVRRDIFSLQLKDRELRPADFDLALLAARSDGFSGAEIEQLIVSGLYRAHASGNPLNTKILVQEIAATRPLSVTMAENIGALRQWATERAVYCD
ncbi:MAG: AAA family ATPase [Pseudomonadota bacterium]